MKGAALADVHIGYRTFPHTTKGRNTREVDVERAWLTAVGQVVSSGASVVTIAGDVFQHPRVSDFAKRAYLEGVRRLLAAQMYVIILQGNHDVGRTTDVLSPIHLAEELEDDSGDEPRLYVITKPEGLILTINRERWFFACFPYVAMEPDPAVYRLEPRADCKNALIMHAAIKSELGERLPFFYGSSAHSLDVGREAARWDVIACGDYHQYTRLHPNRLAFYSGALERTSSDIWHEYGPKGWVLWDSDAGSMALIEVPGRAMGDLQYTYGLTAEDLNKALAEVASRRNYADAMVRLLIDGFPLEERDHIDWALVRKIKASFMHFYLDIRYKRREVASLGDRRDGVRTLASEAVAFFEHDDEEVRNAALFYLGVEADAEEVIL